MDYLQRLVKQARLDLFFAVLLTNAALIGAWWGGSQGLHLAGWQLALVLVGVALAFSVIAAVMMSGYLLEPVRALWQTILHLSPHEQGIAAPDMQKLSFGRDLVTSLSSHIYQLTAVAEQVAAADHQKNLDLQANFVASNLPLPLVVLDNTETIQYANQAAAHYIGQSSSELIGKNVYMVLDMAFPSEDTFDKWLKDAKQRSATAVKSWERVKLNVSDSHPKQLFDLAAYYNKGNTQKWETMLVLFDHTDQYSQDDQAVGFIAISVHELRTPLMLLRGYIEALEDEMHDKLTPEMHDFMVKMNATAQQLTAFVNNILNVARVDDDQMDMHLQEENWEDIIKSAVENLKLRAQVRGIELEYSVEPDLPPVGVDRLSIYEVISNLVDNAVKYSGNGKTIKIRAHLTSDGLVETTVQDLGVGVPPSVVPKLFTKFYRDHRNRAQVGGTGLGLYLSKAIVNAHGGNIWVRSKEGEGSTFGFTVLPFANLAEELKNSNNNEIVRGAHGWIKNHSLYRR